MLELDFEILVDDVWYTEIERVSGHYETPDGQRINFIRARTDIPPFPPSESENRCNGATGSDPPTACKLSYNWGRSEPVEQNPGRCKYHKDQVVVTPADIVVDSITIDAPSPTVGTPTDVTVGVTNTGGSSGEAAFEVTDNGSKFEEVTFSLDASESATSTFTWVPPDSGTRTIAAGDVSTEIDVTGSVAEYQVETSDIETAKTVADLAETVITEPEPTDEDSPTTDYLVTGEFTEDAISTVEQADGVENVTKVGSVETDGGYGWNGYGGSDEYPDFGYGDDVV